MERGEIERKRNETQRAKDNERRRKMAEALYCFITESAGGIDFWQWFKNTCGAHHSSFSARDNFNPHGAAFRDGMRETFNQVFALIEEHKQTKKNHE